MNRLAAFVVVVTLLTASTGRCDGLPDSKTAEQLSLRLERSLGDGDSLRVVFADIDSWVGQAGVVESISRRELLIEYSAVRSAVVEAVMMTMLYNAYWVGWELSERCCRNLLDSVMLPHDVTKPMEMVRKAYLVRNLDGECARFDLAFQSYIDALPMTQQMAIYLRVAGIGRLAVAVAEERQKDPVRAAEAVETLREILGKDEFREFMNVYK